MTPRKTIRDVPASVRQRLLNLAREQRVRFEAMLQRYAIERFLYRLSASDEVDRFTLKGAALLRMWTGQELRPTRDIDFLARGARDEAAIRTALRDVCGMPCREDGVVFDPATISITSIRLEQPDGGLRVRIRGGLGRVRSPSRSTSASATSSPSAAGRRTTPHCSTSPPLDVPA